MARNTAELLQITGSAVNPENVMAIVQTLPRDIEDIQSDIWKKGVLSRLLELRACYEP